MICIWKWEVREVTLGALCPSPLLSCNDLWLKQQHRSLYWSADKPCEVETCQLHEASDELHSVRYDCPCCLLTSSCVCPRVSRFRQVIGTSLISTSATTRSSLAFVDTGGFPIPTAWERMGGKRWMWPLSVNQSKRLYYHLVFNTVILVKKYLKKTHWGSKLVVNWLNMWLEYTMFYE